MSNKRNPGKELRVLIYLLGVSIGGAFLIASFELTGPSATLAQALALTGVAFPLLTLVDQLPRAYRAVKHSIPEESQ